MATDPFRDALDELAAIDAVERLYARDVALWPGDAEVVGNRLGWLDVAGGVDGWRERLRRLVAEIRGDGIDRVLLVGMGGSSLAPGVFAQVLGPSADGLPLEVLDSTHPDAVRAAFDDRDLSRTLVVVSSKSGTTEETRDFGAHAARLLPGPAQLVAVTDPGSALAAEARDGGWRAVFENPPDIGGRYSALSLFGMLPAALLGIDLDELWRGGAAMLERCRATAGDHGGRPHANPGVELAAFMGGYARAGRDKLTLLAPLSLAPVGDWIEQLVAESTGKDGRGIVPVVGETPGSPKVYGDDRAFVALRLAGQPVPEADALAAAGHPVLNIEVADPLDLGAEFVRWEVATALAGALLGVNPFDEPNVAESKANTAAVLDDVAHLPEPEPERGDVAGLLAGIRPGDYLSIQAYLNPTAEHAAVLQRLRHDARDRLCCATTFGWGPRFLHSTGQLHKGGPDTVVVLQVVDIPNDGPDIPGRPFDFATLIRAQAAGDLRSLRTHGRRVAQVTVDGPADLETMAGAAIPL